MSHLRGRAILAAVVLAPFPAEGLAARYDVSVVRDTAGIPHFRAHDFVSLGYGEGYAFAQDNLCTFADDVVTLRAQRSPYFGPDNQSIGYASGAADPNIKSDGSASATRASIASWSTGGRPRVRRPSSSRSTAAGRRATTPSCARATCGIGDARASRGSSRSPSAT